MMTPEQAIEAFGPWPKLQASIKGLIEESLKLQPQDMKAIVKILPKMIMAMPFWLSQAKREMERAEKFQARITKR